MRACVRVCVCVCVRAGGQVACTGGVRFSNSNRIIPSDYRILLLLKMPIPTTYNIFLNKELVTSLFLNELKPQLHCYGDNSYTHSISLSLTL